MNILLVDDDSAIIKTLLPILKGLEGHEIRVSTTAEKAHEHAKELGRLDLLLTDVMMEPVDGFTLRDELRAEHKGMRTILLTGYDLDDYPEQTKGYRVLLKPIDVADLREAVEIELAAIELEPEKAPESPESPEIPMAPEAPEEPLEEPEESEKAEVTEATEKPEAPAESKEPEKVESPQKPEKLDVPEQPAAKTPFAEPKPAPSVPPVVSTPKPPSAPSFAGAPSKLFVPGAKPATPVAKPPAATPPPEIHHEASEAKPDSQTQAPVAPTPVATPAASPAPSKPSVPSVPSAKPAAVPKPSAAPAAEMPVPAAPTEIPMPTVSAVPKASAPAATPAVPSGVPKIPMPTAKAAPATPTAAPSGVPKIPMPSGKPATMPPTATAAPSGVAKIPMPSGKPAPVPASAVPKAAPGVAVPVAKPAAVAAPRPGAAAPKVARSASGVEAESLEGRQLGAYKIVRKLSEGSWGPEYEAEQTNMGRLVAMKVLSDERQNDPEARKNFIANASAKANLQHPLILSVYEAGEADGHCYYTHEHVDGDSFAKMAENGETIDEPTALRAIRVAGEGCGFMTQSRIPHSRLEASCLLVGSDKRPRLANLATWQDEEPPDTVKEISSLAEIITSVLPDGQATEPGMQSLLARMKLDGEGGFMSWPALLQAVKALEPKVIPADAFKLGAQEEAAIRAVDEGKKRQKRSLIMGSLGMAALVGILGFVLWYFLLRTNERNLDGMVKVPAGEFIFQDGKKETLPDFWIGEYEVTIGQYARFLRDLEKNPTKEYDHPDQPAGKSHVPLNWNIYYGRAKAGKPAKFIPIDLNSPIFNVDWWDAYAFAKWRGQRLPTEKEWEKAARGTDGRKYPWGNEFDASKVNSMKDYIARPGPNSEAKVDGWFWWGPVDAMKGDKSPNGAIGMAGNLNEWTATWEDTPDGKFPVIRGGSYRSAKEDGTPNVETTFRAVGLDPERAEEYLGIRTASDTKPE